MVLLSDDASARGPAVRWPRKLESQTAFYLINLLSVAIPYPFSESSSVLQHFLASKVILPYHVRRVNPFSIQRLPPANIPTLTSTLRTQASEIL